MTLGSQSFTVSNQRDCSLDASTSFWQQWQQYRDSLYRCCIKWMGGNFIDAEDALSRAMLKAWEKVQKYAAGEIANFKAWLTKLTYNLCIDIYRERSRGANRVEDIEAIPQKQGLVSFDDTPLRALETHEQKIVIRRAIDNLPIRLRETFILHFYGELSHQEIAQQQDISYQNVCKRISEARAILREALKGYFIGEERTDTELSVTPTLAAIEPATEELSQPNAAVEAGAGETVVSVAVNKVEIVGDEVGGDMQHTESVMSAASSDGKLEVKSDACWCVELALGKRQLAQILALAQFDEETGRWGNSCLALLWRQKQHQVEKVAGEFVRSSRSPPVSCLSYVQSLVKSLSGIKIRLRFF
jgi:RNA polymerase sigma factor (sigma-70 family)